MTFSDQFIKILDALCDKVGITVDWTSSNVLPYLQDLVQRFVKYTTYTSIAWLIITIIVILLSLYFLRREFKKDYKEGMIITICIASLIVGCLVGISNTMNIIEVNTIPEKTIIKYIKYLNE